MLIDVYPGQAPIYVPDILFEDGTYASPEAYARIHREKEAEAAAYLAYIQAKRLTTHTRKRKPKAA